MSRFPFWYGQEIGAGTYRQKTRALSFRLSGADLSQKKGVGPLPLGGTQDLLDGFAQKGVVWAAQGLGGEKLPFDEIDVDLTELHLLEAPLGKGRCTMMVAALANVGKITPDRLGCSAIKNNPDYEFSITRDIVK